MKSSVGDPLKQFPILLVQMTSLDLAVMGCNVIKIPGKAIIELLNAHDLKDEERHPHGNLKTYS